jgi:uncharacterized protein (UPF0276 family)
MQLAVNISAPAERLLEQGRIDFDFFKLPAWPDLLRGPARKRPAYVHFPLKAGSGIADAFDTETNQPAHWDTINALLEISQTPHVNVHLAPRLGDCPEIDPVALDPASIEKVTTNLLRDVNSVTRRFGPQRVIVEGIYDHQLTYLHQALLPQVIRRVVEETGCGFLLDLSHARLAARCLGIDPYDYLNQLPTAQLREIHVTGIQLFDERWIGRLRQTNADMSKVLRFAGALMDHLPMIQEDWVFFTWAMEQIRQRNWAAPWVVTFEYGGIGSWWADITDESILMEQVPRLLALVRSNSP